MEELTPPQRRVLDFIEGQVRRSGIPPTVREIARRLSVSIGTVQGHLSTLERKGVIEKTPETARGLAVAARRDDRKKLRLPVLGRVPAGVPIEAISNVEDYLSVDEAIARRANFVLRVKGDSMLPDIREGDLVLVQTTPMADNGDVVIAYVDDGEATVKRLRKAEREMYLEAANPAYPPIKKRFTIVGKVTSLIRTFF